VIVSNGPLAVPENDAESYTIELLLRPATVSGSRTILGFYVPHRGKRLLVRQYFDGLLVTHDGSIDRDRTRTTKFDVDHVFRTDRFSQVTISSGESGTTVYVDGQIAEEIPTFKLSRDELSADITLGTSPVGYHPWTGDVRGLAIYSKELTPAEALQHYSAWTEAGSKPDLNGALARYSFRERTGGLVRNEVASGVNLKIPDRFSVPHKEFLSSATSEFQPEWRYAVDVIINIAGFVPLGVIVCASVRWFRGSRQSIVITTIACGFLSLTIEILQYYVPRRGSGMTDIITNTLGAAIGAALAQARPVRRCLEAVRLIPRS